MKVRTDCLKCRKEIYKQAEKEFLKHEYSVFSDSAYTMAVYSTVAVLAVQIKKGRSKKYIQQLYNDMVAIFDMPQIFGKVITLTDIMKRLEREYGIDFKRIKVHLESEQEFIKGVKKSG